MDHTAFLKLAIDEAIKAVNAGQGPFGSVVARQSELIVAAQNSVWQSCDPTSHAEIQAIRKACSKIESVDLSGCTIYTSCEPCPMCFAAIHWARIDSIYFSASIADAKAAGFRELEISATDMKRLGKSPVTIVGNLLETEGRRPFDLFKSRNPQKRY